MRIPAWLDPFWQLDYDVSSTMSTDAASAALRPQAGRLRGRFTAGGEIVVVRHGGLMNQFVRARVAITPRDGGSNIRVRIARPGIVKGFFVFGLVFVVAIPFLDMLELAVFDRSRLLQAAVFSLIGALIWVIVIGANYTSARSEATDLQKLIGRALEAAV